MGFGIKELLIILVIIILLFGTKKLRNIGSDLGGAVKGFRKSMTDDDKSNDEDDTEILEDRRSDSNIIEGKAEQVKSEDK